VEDLLTHFPRRYEDRKQFDRFPSDEMDKPVCVCGIVKKASARRIRGGQKMFDALLEEENAHALSTPLLCRWFNAHWVEKVVASGQRIVVYGRPKRSGSSMVIAHPEFEIVENDAEKSIHLDRIAPIHGGTEGLSPRVIRRIIWDTLERIDPATVRAVLPPDIDPFSRADALRQIHFPDSFALQEKARRHLVLTEFFAMQLCIASKRAEIAALPGAPHCGRGDLTARLHASLPFDLTGAQKRAIREIATDLAEARPMNRLLHGDVGSGKTLVALSAMLLAVEAGFETALMAPTQILAEQHYLNFKRLLDPLQISVALRTGSRKEDATPLPLFAGGSGPPRLPSGARQKITVGTHALLYEDAGMNNLGLVVIDEQHKFGVMQRARLREKGSAPDVLVMTATPIPRTLTMTIYGDLDVSTLDELPANRGKIVTAARDVSKLPKPWRFFASTWRRAGRLMSFTRSWRNQNVSTPRRPQEKSRNGNIFSLRCVANCSMAVSRLKRRKRSCNDSGMARPRLSSPRLSSRSASMFRTPALCSWRMPNASVWLNFINSAVASAAASTRATAYFSAQSRTNQRFAKNLMSSSRQPTDLPLLRRISVCAVLGTSSGQRKADCRR
jgi:ATP-dependent DNA helicase RecG